METWLQEIKETVNQLPNGNVWKKQYIEVYKNQQADTEIKGKFEVTLPIIPGILSYKGELSGAFKTKIRDIRDDLKKGF